MGYDMILYPTTLLFRAVHALQQALDDLRQGKPLVPEASVDLAGFEDIVRMSEWAGIESRFMDQSHDGMIKKSSRGCQDSDPARPATKHFISRRPAVPQSGDICDDHE